MADRNDLTAAITTLVKQRVALETRLQNEPGELTETLAGLYGDEYGALQRNMAALFKQTTDETQRITALPPAASPRDIVAQATLAPEMPNSRSGRPRRSPPQNRRRSWN